MSNLVAIRTEINKAHGELAKALPKSMDPDRIERIGLTCVRQNPKIAECHPHSIIGALMQSAQLGLEPLDGKAYLVPFWNSKTRSQDVQFIVGYKGFIDLFYRHPKARSIEARTVYENDEFTYCYGLNPNLIHNPISNPDERGEPIAYYAVATMEGDVKQFHVMTHKDCMEHGKKHSQGFDKSWSVWQKETDQMCKKTVIRQLYKTLPMSIEMSKALTADGTVKRYKEGQGSVLELKDEIDHKIDNSMTAEEAADIAQAMED